MTNTNKSKKIYRSTEYVEKDEIGILKLEVISQWDFSTKPVAFGTIYKGKPNQRTIPYSLRKCIKVIKVGHTKWKTLETEEITEEMVKELKKMDLRLVV